MINENSVAAFIDLVDDEIAVWWLSIGKPIPGFSRRCGAWVLRLDDPRIADLVLGKFLGGTARGIEFAGRQPFPIAGRLDGPGTVRAIEAEITRLSGLVEQENVARTKAKQLTAPHWPHVPEPANDQVESAAFPRTGHADRLSPVMEIVAWWDQLCGAWSTIEDVRLQRSWLARLDQPERRCMPVVLA